MLEQNFFNLGGYTQSISSDLISYRRGEENISSSESMFLIAGDIGGSTVRWRFWNSDKKEFAEEQPQEESMEDVETASDILNIFSRDAERIGIDFDEKVYSISLGCAGVIDPEEPRVNLGSNVNELDFTDTDWAPIVYLENDVATAAVAEYFNHDKEYSNIAHMNFGTGTNCGVVKNDEVQSDTELGFVPINFDDSGITALDRPGVLEAYTSGSGIPEFYSKWRREKNYSQLSEELDAEQIFDRYGEDRAVERFIEEDLSKACAAGLATAINSYNPDVLTVGGSVMLENDEEPDLLELAKEHLERTGWAIYDLEKDIETTDLRNDITIYGALDNISLRDNYPNLEPVPLGPLREKYQA